MSRTATHYNTLQHTATHCNTLQHTATHCKTLHHNKSYCTQYTRIWHMNILTHTIIYTRNSTALLNISCLHYLHWLKCVQLCIIFSYFSLFFDRWCITSSLKVLALPILQHMQYTATHCSNCRTLQEVTSRTQVYTLMPLKQYLSFPAAHCNTLQHTATHNAS